MSEFLIKLAKAFPKGSIKQTRYLILPFSMISLAVAWFYSDLSTIEKGIWVLSSGLTWTLLEYILHRWLLHYPAKSEVGKVILARLHVIHHDHPEDGSQVCVPMLLSAPLWLMIYGLIVLMGGGSTTSWLFVSGVAVMMTFYDSVHYFTHYETAKTRYGKFLKKHHMLHHFKDDTVRYGVTSPLWDYFFHTYR